MCAWDSDYYEQARKREMEQQRARQMEEQRKRRMEETRKKRKREDQRLKLRDKQAKIKRKKRAAKKRVLDMRKQELLEQCDEFGIPLKPGEKRKGEEEEKSGPPSIKRGLGVEAGKKNFKPKVAFKGKGAQKKKKDSDDPEERDEFSVGGDLPGPAIPEQFRL